MNFDSTASTEEQFSSLELFIDSIIKRLNPTGIDGEIPFLPDAVPTPLRLIWNKNRGRKGGLISFNKLFYDKKSYPGRLIFCRESNASHCWSIDLESQNPAVWYHPLNGYFSQNGDPVPEQGRLCEFLLQLLVFEFIVGAPHRRQRMAMNANLASRILSICKPLPLSSWQYPLFPYRFYAFGSVYLFIYQRSGNHAILYCGSESITHLAELDKIAKWDFSTDEKS